MRTIFFTIILIFLSVITGMPALKKSACPCSENFQNGKFWTAIERCETALKSRVEDCRPDSIYLILGRLKLRLERAANQTYVEIDMQAFLHFRRQFEKYAKERQGVEYHFNEIGGSYIYNGSHFKELIKKFPKSNLADNAAYELTKLSLGGECEGWLDCYIQGNFAQVKDFIKKYPNSEFTAEAVKRANDAFILNLKNPNWIKNFGPIKDYSVAQDSYDPVAIQKTLENYEIVARNLPPTLRAKAFETIAGLWEKFKKTERARQLYNFIINKVPEYENISAVRKRLSNLSPEQN